MPQSCLESCYSLGSLFPVPLVEGNAGLGHLDPPSTEQARRGLSHGESCSEEMGGVSRDLTSPCLLQENREQTSEGCTIPPRAGRPQLPDHQPLTHPGLSTVPSVLPTPVVFPVLLQPGCSLTDVLRLWTSAHLAYQASWALSPCLTSKYQGIPGPPF